MCRVRAFTRITRNNGNRAGGDPTKKKASVKVAPRKVAVRARTRAGLSGGHVRAEITGDAADDD